MLLFFQGEIAPLFSPVTLILIRRIPAPILFPCFTSLLRPVTPPWFRLPISKSLSLLPLRPEGVKHTISFIANNVLQAPSDVQTRARSKAGHAANSGLSLEVLEHVSKLLSSVPSSVAPDWYFSNLAPQLLQLLDDANLDNQRVAAYVIGNGILGRRKYGSPGAIGWRIFTQPLLDSFIPNKEATEDSSVSTNSTNENGLSRVIVCEDSLQTALMRLSSLVLLHPNPGLTKRLISPVVTSLWELLCYSTEIKRRKWALTAHQILHVFYKTSAGLEHLMSLADNLLQNDLLPWEYGCGPTGGIEIRKKVGHRLTNPSASTLVASVDHRINEFLRLTMSGIVDDEQFGILFVHIAKSWLLDGKAKRGEKRLELGGDMMSNPLQSLLHAKLAQKILEEFKDRLASSHERIIDLLNHVLSAHVTDRNGFENQQNNPSNSSPAGIFNFNYDYITPPDESKEFEPEDLEIISVAFSLLSSILSAPDFSLDLEIFNLLNAVRNNIVRFTLSSASLPTSHTMAAKNVLTLIDMHVFIGPPEDKIKQVPSDPFALDQKTHHLALSYLADSLPPVRAQGLSLLADLICKHSPVIDVPSTTILLQSLLQDDDEFIYLSTIKNLGSLASRHPNTVVRMLVEQYIDAEEKTGLDVRIKTGEALLKVVESLGTTLAGNTAKLLGQSMITVAGRRGKKPRSMEARARMAEEKQASRREAEAAWDGPVPSSELAPDDEQQYQAKVLSAWEGSPGEDDLRVRASALSILGSCIETSLLGIGATLISTAMDIAISILRLEREPEHAILRRASVLLVMSLVRALDAAEEEEHGQRLGIGVDERGLEVVMVLKAVSESDEDEIVREHVTAVVEGLEALREKALWKGLRGIGRGEGSGLGLEIPERGLKGLGVLAGEENRPDPRIEEVG